MLKINFIHRQLNIQAKDVEWKMTYRKKKIRILITIFISPSIRNAVTRIQNFAEQLQAINE